MEASAKGVECPHCHHSNLSGTFRCASCDSWFGPVDATMTNVPLGPDWSRATKAQASFDNPAGSLQVGSILGARYEILKLLGEGGMGAVYKARDLELDRLIALKVIRPELAGNPSILHRFKQELILARKITHRNVIRIYDLGVAERTRFITMEFIEGRDLASLLEERKYTPEEAVEILSQVCAALEAAHAEGVVHRDLKPQNIMIEDAGRVVVMDFGLARSMEATGMTQAGTVMGTPTYMSPEQVKGLPADERSDLFALGIIFYQMLTGEVPYKADTMLATMALRTQGPPPPPIQLDPAVPQPLNDMVLKSLATDPPDRYQRAALLGKDLHDWEEGTLHRAIVTPPMAIMAESKTGKWIALTVGAAVVAMAGIYGVQRRGILNVAGHLSVALKNRVDVSSDEVRESVSRQLAVEGHTGVHLKGTQPVHLSLNPIKTEGQLVRAQCHPDVFRQAVNIRENIAGDRTTAEVAAYLYLASIICYRRSDVGSQVAHGRNSRGPDTLNTRTREAGSERAHGFRID